MSEIFSNRKWIIFPVSELYKINWSQVLEEQNEIRRTTIDGTKTFVKWDGEQTPSCVQTLSNTEGPFNFSEIVPILSSYQWVGTRP